MSKRVFRKASANNMVQNGTCCNAKRGLGVVASQLVWSLWPPGGELTTKRGEGDDVKFGGGESYTREDGG